MLFDSYRLTHQLTNRLYSFNGKNTTILEVLPLYSVEVSTCHVEQVRIP